MGGTGADAAPWIARGRRRGPVRQRAQRHSAMGRGGGNMNGIKKGAVKRQEARTRRGGAGEAPQHYGGEKSKRRKSGKAYNLGTKRVRSGNWSNIQSIAFSFALLSKRNGFAFGVRSLCLLDCSPSALLATWPVLSWRYLPYDLFVLASSAFWERWPLGPSAFRIPSLRPAPPRPAPNS